MSEQLIIADQTNKIDPEVLKEILLELMLHHRHVIVVPDNIRGGPGCRFVCEYWRDFEDGFHRCPNNENGICSTVHETIPWLFVHKFNGRKMYRCPCG